MNIILEPYKKEEAKRISKIVIKNLLEVNTLDYKLEEMEELANHYQVEDIKKMMKDRLVFVAKENGKVIGTGGISNTMSDDKHDYWVYTLFIDVKYHGKGIGKLIMNRLEDEAKKLGGTRIVIPASLTSHRFYTTLGYNYIGGTAIITEEKVYMLEKFL